MVASAPAPRGTAVVFGADHPLGAVAAVALAAGGWSVLVVGTEERLLGATVGEIAFGGGRARLFCGSGAHDVEAPLARATEVFGAGEAPLRVFGPGWEPPPASPAVTFVLRPCASLEQAQAQARAVDTSYGHVFVAPGGDDPTQLATVLSGPPAVHVLPADVLA
jgi:NAD(P)-dependent dehydrogenase (short-subunit alcohol dehydrogenase family)